MQLRSLSIALSLCLPAAFAAADTTLSFHTYGLINGPGDAARSLVARRWHLQYISVAGCVVTQELIDSAAAHNAKTEAALVQRHGKEWKLRFEAETDAETKRQKYIAGRLDSSDQIRQLRSALRKDYNTPWYRFDFNEQTRRYIVEVKAWDKKSQDYKTYYTLTAGLNYWDLQRN